MVGRGNHIVDRGLAIGIGLAYSLVPHDWVAASLRSTAAYPASSSLPVFCASRSKASALRDRPWHSRQIGAGIMGLVPRLGGLPTIRTGPVRILELKSPGSLGSVTASPRSQLELQSNVGH